MSGTINKETLGAINQLRGMIRLNGGDYLKPLTEEDVVRNLEYAEQQRKRREKETEEKREKLYKMIDGKVHKISEECPANELYTYDNVVDYEFDFDFFYSEEQSYYVTVHPHGDKNKKMIARYFETCMDSRKTIKWSATSGYVDIDDDDTWEYTQEAFDYGLAKSE